MVFKRLNLYKVYTISLIIGLFPVFANAGTIINDSNSSELTALKQSVEVIFKAQCPEIQSAQSGLYSLDLTECLPIRISRILGRHASIGGPNCYNFALYSLGVIDSLRPVNSSEIENLIFSKDKGVCEEVSDKSGIKKPGDLISLEQKSSNSDQTTKIHAYVYLTKKYALTKNGPETDSLWQIDTIDRILKVYPIAEEDRKDVRYKCKTLQTKDNDTTIKAISSFSIFISETQLNLSNVKTDMVKSHISQLAKILTANNLETLIKNSTDPAVQMKLYEVVSHFYVIKNFYYGLSNIEASSFQKYAEMYVGILERILSASDNTYGIEDVSNFEDSLEYEYCGKTPTSILCSMGH